MALQAANANLSSLSFPSHTKRHTRTSNGRSCSRLNISASAAASPVASTSSRSIRLTYLEANSWIWDIGGVNVLVDPILVGNLDFGAPWMFDGAKKFLRNFKIDDLPDLDCLLITQSLDDHCHIKTLTPLSKRNPDLPVIATPNAESILQPLFSNVTYLEPGEKTDLEGKDGAKVNICATAGPVLGPPWQRPENGYIVKPGENGLSLYYEPHCVYNESFLENYRADVVITPVIKQVLPFFTLVSGQEDAIKLAKLLQAKYIVPMRNGDLDTKGVLSSILSSVGTMEAFQEMLVREIPNAKLLQPTPGLPLEISYSSIS
ncbi:Metallo-hydrolase/oxidoreductase superfamily protein [Rhynchospora pubera]|uniref:Metallo-hydrolase/oxidoreductase superfamily protein n=1 Tax=Rhynchospora pubera TaxID=906938 RepID=A0AAV8DT65_9POAL|nr:Metallo-hydrolase/oxidoreductase superfamily protein [Rhynchospora pubera]KAJ4781761.1 Metallo-hydrolase/oxidoreductase superfamily protein [Rhynchospora pubera]